MTAEPVALTADLFEPSLGQVFQVAGWPHGLALSLVERGEKQPWHVDMGISPFTLIFSGPPGEVLAEGMHSIALEGGAAHALYLSPIHTPAPGRQDYQAVFN